MYGYTYKFDPRTGEHIVETSLGVFPAQTRDEAIRLAGLAERREEQRLAIIGKQDRRSTYSSVMRNRKIWG
jgi:hypothetical protein